jgi:hypothetical protein
VCPATTCLLSRSGGSAAGQAPHSEPEMVDRHDQYRHTVPSPAALREWKLRAANGLPLTRPRAFRFLQRDATRRAGTRRRRRRASERHAVGCCGRVGRLCSLDPPKLQVNESPTNKQRETLPTAKGKEILALPCSWRCRRARRSNFDSWPHYALAGAPCQRQVAPLSAALRV